MKKTNTAFVFGALVVASFAAVRCGGDDSNNSATTTGTAGTTVNTGGSAGSANGAGGADNGGTADNGGSANNGGANNGGSANNGGANNGGANNGGANNGGSANRDGGGGTAVGAGGTQVGGDAGMCPGMAPMGNNDMCTGNVTCDYPGAGPNGSTRGCTCVGGGPRIDGGARSRVWFCVNIPVPRDAGAGNPDAGVACPNGTGDGDRCMTELEICRLGGRGGGNCVCIPGNGGNLSWACN